MADRINALVDAALIAEREATPPRTYLGASRLGHACERALQFEFAGAPKDVVLWFASITAYIGFLTHANIRVRCGWLNYVFNTPTLHRWHHSKDLREWNKNYGENLMLWDLVFGTYYDDTSRRPSPDIGIKSAMPKSFWGQVVEPFRWKKFQASAKDGTARHELL